jgi:hypothetical protein
MPTDFRQFTGALTSPTLRAIAEHWNDARGDCLMPAWEDLSSPALSPHFAKLWAFQHQPDTEDFTGRLAGKNIRDWLGANFWGASMKELYPPDVFREAYQFLVQVIAIPAAGRSHGRLFWIGERIVLGERIALPLASDGVHGDAVLGASDYDTSPVTGPVRLIHENLEWFHL